MSRIARPILASARRGDADAQYKVAALLIERGDYPAAAAWLQLAASQGYAPAQNSLGNLSSLGLGVPKSLQQAAYWYYQASLQGHQHATENLAALFDHCTPYDGNQLVMHPRTFLECSPRQINR